MNKRKKLVKWGELNESREERLVSMIKETEECNAMLLNDIKSGMINLDSLVRTIAYLWGFQLYLLKDREEK